jgi:plastocyanin
VTPSGTRSVLLAGCLFAAALAGSGCTDNGGNGPGNPGAAGTGGSTAGNSGGGSGGAGGTSAGGTGGGTPGFMSIAPCPNESDYVTGTTVDFGVINNVAAYAPKCLRVTYNPVTTGAGGTPGRDVTFNGDFQMHPLEPSALRGAQTGNPITSTGAGTTKTFRFSTPGFFAYFCDVHNPSDNGAAMSGVVWVTEEIFLP